MKQIVKIFIPTFGSFRNVAKEAKNTSISRERFIDFIKVIGLLMITFNTEYLLDFKNSAGDECIVVEIKLNRKKTRNWFIKKYYKKYYSKISHIFCEDEFTYQFIKNEKIAECSIIGNTRINQILLDKEDQFKDEKIMNFIDKKRTIIYGSVENNDYDKIIKFIHSRKDLKHIIVPHEINTTIIKKIKEKILSNYILYSAIEKNREIQNNILIVDKFGILKHLYKYSNIAYVGGGVNNGIHNTLEAVVHGNFVLFGPKHKQFEESYWLIEQQIGKSIRNYVELSTEINDFLKTPQSKENITKKILSFLKTKQQNLNFIIKTIENTK